MCLLQFDSNLFEHCQWLCIAECTSVLTSSVDLLQSFRHLMHENEHLQGTEPTGKVIAYSVYSYY